MKKTLIAFALIVVIGYTSCQKLKVATPETEELQPEGDGPIVAGFQRTNTSITSEQLIGIRNNPQEFRIGPIASDAGYTYIANNTVGDFGVLVYSVNEKKVVKTIKEWTINGTTEKFTNPISGLYIANGKLYVANVRYRVDVFNSEDQSFITTLGNGLFMFDETGKVNPNGFNTTSAVVVTGGKVYVRDRTGLVVFNESDVTAANYKKVPIFAQSSGTNLEDNINLSDIPMSVTPDGNILIAAFGKNKLCYVDTKLVGNEDFWFDESKSIVDLPDKVEAVAATKDAYVLLMGEKVYKYTLATKQLLEIGTALSLQESYDIYKDGNKLWVSSKGNQISVLNILNQ